VVQLDNFEGQVIAITGAGSGFGKLLAESLSASGAKLVLSDVNEEALRQVAVLCQATTQLLCVMSPARMTWRE
jgi:NADP-dependent 3-hydroxy acid dehydrogenase YdfG